MVRQVVSVVVLAAMVGCATPGMVVVKLTPPGAVAGSAAVAVNDEREHKQLAMQTRSYDASNSTFLLATVPTIDEVVRQHLQGAINGRTVGPVTVALQSLDLVNQVGFAKADAITCSITSRVGQRVVRTDSVNRDNMSPFIATAAQRSLDQCLAEHATQIAATVLAH